MVGRVGWLVEFERSHRDRLLLICGSQTGCSCLDFSSLHWQSLWGWWCRQSRIRIQVKSIEGPQTNEKCVNLDKGNWDIRMFPGAPGAQISSGAIGLDIYTYIGSLAFAENIVTVLTNTEFWTALWMLDWLIDRLMIDIFIPQELARTSWEQRKRNIS